MNSITIEQGRNGFILTGCDENVPFKILIEEQESDDTNLNECKVYQKLFLEIQNLLGLYNSKHNKYRLEIKITDQKGNEIDDIGELNE